MPTTRNHVRLAPPAPGELKPARKVLDTAHVKRDMVVHPGQIATEIVALAKPGKYDLLVLGANRRNAVADLRWFSCPKRAGDCTDSSAASDVACERLAGRDANPVTSHIDASFRPLISRSTQRHMDLSDFTDDPEDPQHTPQERAAAASRSTWVSVVVNLILTITQVVVGLLSKSQGLVADGIHSLSDLVADFVVLFASHHAQKDADEDHPYGHQRFETAASLVLGGLLLAVGVGMLWSAFRKLEEPDTVQKVHAAALWVATGALIAKEVLFRYMLSVAKRVKSSMLVANAWHARSDAASSLVVGVGIIGNLAGYPILDPIAALIVGFMVAKMGWGFGWDAMHDLMDRSADEAEVQAIRKTLIDTSGVRNVHDVRTRKMGDMIVVDAHLEVDASLSVEAGHDIAVDARQRVLQRHRVLNLMTHVDPWRRPDLDHSEPTAAGP
jgi:cation diffusion facilitator family transporter